ncbi:MAG: PIG-L family deacetylase [Planctomycetia bacterium]|nr:PIG-L family deacetylase [Planctomycetia bacterium]
MPRRAFAIAAHPDDIEFVMAGTLLRLRAAGYEIHYMNVANGCCGSSTHDAAATVALRRAEAMQACELVGAVFHESLTNDLEIFYDKPLLSRLAAIVREVAPRIVLTHAPADYMEDHMNASRLAVTAAFARGMPNFPVDPPTPTFDDPVTIYHAQPHGNRDALWQPVRPGIFVDVTGVLNEKTAMLIMHQSQKQWLDESQGFDSYLEAMRELSREVGRMSGRFEYAEGWRKHSHLGFCGPDDDPLVTALPAELVVVDTNGT